MSRRRIPIASARASAWATVAMRRSAADSLPAPFDPARVARDQVVVHGRFENALEEAVRRGDGGLGSGGAEPFGAPPGVRAER